MRYGELITEKEFDLACLGIGENGHLAFNEPHAADFKDPLPVKIVDLDEVCRRQQIRDFGFKSMAEVPPTGDHHYYPAPVKGGGHLLHGSRSSKGGDSTPLPFWGR